jgi:hypothetical protein
MGPDDRLGAALRRLVDAVCDADLPDDAADALAARVEALAEEVAASPPLVDPATRYFQSSPLVGFRTRWRRPSTAGATAPTGPSAT